MVMDPGIRFFSPIRYPFSPSLTYHFYGMGGRLFGEGRAVRTGGTCQVDLCFHKPDHVVRHVGVTRPLGGDGTGAPWTEYNPTHSFNASDIPASLHQIIAVMPADTFNHLGQRMRRHSDRDGGMRYEAIGTHGKPNTPLQLY